MNNSDINDAKWMTLRQQMGYMFAFTLLTIFLALGFALNNWVQVAVLSSIRTPFAFVLKWTGIRSFQSSAALVHQSIEDRGDSALGRRMRHREGAGNTSVERLDSRESFNVRKRKDDPKTHSFDSSLGRDNVLDQV